MHYVLRSGHPAPRIDMLIWLCLGWQGTKPSHPNFWGTHWWVPPQIRGATTEEGVNQLLVALSLIIIIIMSWRKLASLIILNIKCAAVGCTMNSCHKRDMLRSFLLHLISLWSDIKHYQKNHTCTYDSPHHSRRVGYIDQRLHSEVFPIDKCSRPTREALGASSGVY